MSRSDDICFRTATELSQLMRRKELSAVEVMRAHLDQIERLNPALNAIVTLLPDRALRAAVEADDRLLRGEPVGPLHGLPVAHKDLILTKGIRTTFGSPIYRNYIPAQDAILVERLRKAGAISIGKTNTPEFGAGSQTYNEIFGETRNPWSTDRTCGGSSGGAAVALATGMIPIADGSDMGGSLRNPASFCNVVGMRPTPGRIPVWPDFMGWWTLSVEGPMARTVEDIALVMSAVAGPDDRSPVSLPEPGGLFTKPLPRSFSSVRVAWSPDFGHLPVEPAVIDVMNRQRHTFEDIGCYVDNAHADFKDADDVFKVLRAFRFATTHAGFLETHRHLLKDTIVWNIEEGLKLRAIDVGEAEMKRTRLYQRVREFMKDFPYMVFPVSQVVPFDIRERWVRQIEGTPMTTYIDWMKSCYYISVLGLPSISVPCGFTSDGLPVGIQIVGRPNDDLGVLQLAYAFEQGTGFWKRRPPVP